MNTSWSELSKHFMKISKKDKTKFFASFSEYPKAPKESSYCEKNPSVLHNPDDNPQVHAPAKPIVKFKAKKIKSLSGSSLKAPKTEEESNAFLVESMSMDFTEQVYNTMFSEEVDETETDVAYKKLPKAFIDADEKNKCKVLSEDEIKAAKEQARLDAMSESERDAEERFGGLS